LRFRYSTGKNGSPVKKAVVYTQDEHKINCNDVDSHAVYITERLQANGFETYIVGGAVRDLILGKKPKDFDIVTAASPGKIKKIFRNARIIGRRFRLVHVFFGSTIIEVSTFRSTRDGLTSNTFGTIEEDVLRRDFSLNALFYDPLKQLVIDYVGGIKDIQRGVIRPLIALSYIFTDDPVRIIRAVKYAAMTGFKLPFSLKRMIQKHSYLLADISPSRLTEEIFKIIYSSDALKIVEALEKLRIYGYLQPNAVELFKTLPGFREEYFKTVAALGKDDFKNASGEALSCLVKDYLERTVDWNGSEGPAELYRNAFILARKFVLPMNPPRLEFDHALKIIFMEHGIPLRRSRFNERHRRKSKNSAAAATK
jgi:poly(A) polymerase